MQKKIYKIRYSRLLKLEVQELGSETIRIVEKHEPEELLINDMYNLLVAKRSHIEALRVPYRGHANTQLLKSKRKERNFLVRTIKFNLEKAVAFDVVKENRDLIVLQIEVTRFLNDYYKSENEVVLIHKLKQLIHEVTINADLSGALRSLNFMEDLESLELKLSDILMLKEARLENVSQRPSANTKYHTEQVIASVKNLLDDIYLAQFKHLALDYSLLIDELNLMLKNIDTLISIRISKNEKKAAQKEAELGNEVNGASVPATTNATGGSHGQEYHPSKVFAASIKKMEVPTSGGETTSIVENGDSRKSEVPKKAVESSWGTLQQPSSNGNA